MTAAATGSAGSTSRSTAMTSRRTTGGARRRGGRRRRPGLDVVGLMTHFATADQTEGPNAAFMVEQLARFRSMVAPLRARFPDALLHAANSAATLRNPDTHLDMVRCGIATYGCSPFMGDPADHDLRPVMALESYLASVKPILGRRRGIWPSAGPRNHHRRIPVGYADGYCRATRTPRRSGRSASRSSAWSPWTRSPWTLGRRRRTGWRPRDLMGAQGGYHRQDLGAATPSTMRSSARSATHNRVSRMNGPVALERSREGRGLGLSGWIVGGAIRDALRGRTVLDMDIAVPGDARSTARDIARAHGAATFPLSDAFGAWRVTGGTLPFQIDLTPLQGADIGEDLARRDLTVNAMALAVEGGDLEDPFGGRGDLAAGILRMVRPDAFTSDPVRLVRLARIACQTGFIIDRIRTLRGWTRRRSPARPASASREMRLIAQEDEAWHDVSTRSASSASSCAGPGRDGAQQTPYHHLDVPAHAGGRPLRVRDPSRSGDLFGATRLSPTRSANHSPMDSPAGTAPVRGALPDVGKARTFGVTAEGASRSWGTTGWARRSSTMVPPVPASTRSGGRRQCVRSICAQPWSTVSHSVFGRSSATVGDIAADIELLILSAATLATDGLAQRRRRSRH